jgi:hypothetical protein
MCIASQAHNTHNHFTPPLTPHPQTPPTHYHSHYTHFPCQHTPHPHTQVLDVIEALFMTIFDGLKTRYAAELEAVQAQYPFVPIEAKPVRLTFAGKSCLCAAVHPMQHLTMNVRGSGCSKTAEGSGVRGGRCQL